MLGSKFARDVPALVWAAIVFGGALLVGVAPCADGDIWWHLAAGREMLARGELLVVDPFSAGALGRAWPDVHWLFQLLVYAVHRQFGLAGLVVGKCLAIALGSLVLLFALPRSPRSWARPLFVTLLLAGLFAARGLLLVRPVIASLLFLAGYFWSLESFRRDGRGERLLLLPLLQVVWANVQGLSALGPALVSAYALAAGLSAWLSKRSAWPFEREATSPARARFHFQAQALTAVGCALAALATPFGWRGVLLPAELFKRLLPGAHNVYAEIAENVPPFALERWSGEFWHLKWAFGFLALALLGAGRRLRLSHLFVVGSSCVLALLSNRNVLLLYWLAAPIAANAAAPTLRYWALTLSRRRAPRVAFAVNALLLAALFSFAGTAAAREPSLAKPTPFRMPQSSVQRLQTWPNGDVFAADHQGGYLIWQLAPRFRPYLDTRLVLRTAEEFAEYLALAAHPERFAAFQAQHHFAYVLLPVAYPDRYLGLIATLYESAAWKLVYSNGSEVLFARSDLTDGAAWDLNDPALVSQISSEIDHEFTPGSKLNLAARLQFATLQLALRQFGRARDLLSALPGRDAEALRARAELGAGELAAAAERGQRLLRSDQCDVSSLNLMAQIAIRRGEAAEAIPFLRRALRVDPFDGEASQLLATLEEVR